MTTTHQNDTATSANLPALDLDAIRPELQALAQATVDKTLQQARDTRTDPVLGCSSALATYYMMMQRNDGRALELILDIVARHVASLTFITSGLKVGIDPKHMDLVRSNKSEVLARLQTDHDPDPRGPSYRADGLVIDHTTGKACLLEFKRQAATIETTRLNQIADNLTVARAQVCDLLYRKHRRMKIEPENVSWAIIDCSDQQLPPRFRDAGVFDLDSLNAICGVQNVAEAYRLSRVLMAAEFRRGEAELMEASQAFVPSQTVDATIEAAVAKARLEVLQEMAPISTPAPAVDIIAPPDDPGAVSGAGFTRVDDLSEPHTTANDPHYADRHTEARIIPLPKDGRCRYGMFGT